MEPLDGVPTYQGSTYTVVTGVSINPSTCFGCASIAGTSLRTLICGSGQRRDKYGICREIYD